MKRCNACDEEFADKYSFCPVDGAPLNALAAALVGQQQTTSSEGARAGGWSAVNTSAQAARGEFNVTMISSTGLARRLGTEISFVLDQLQRAWPEFKRDPLDAAWRGLLVLASRFRRLLLTPNALASGVSAMLAVLFAVLALLLLGRARPQVDYTADIEQPVVQFVSLLPSPTLPPEGSGVGAGLNGRVGLAKGKGEGSESEPQRSRGGGGGGEKDPLPANQGAAPQPSQIPAPINPPLPNAVLPVSGIDIDPVLWQSLPSANYGDPRSKSTAVSKGPGDNGGIGTGDGLGIGEGNGNGFGAGNDGNIGGGNNKRGNGGIGGAHGNDPRDTERVWTTRDLTQKARVISKPEAGYTEEARKLDITGTVVLRVVFSVSGQVTGIHTIKPLPGGLTERAIAAARQIRFIPAMRDGQPVSCYMQLEYNFNLY